MRYQMYHALALVAVMAAVARWPDSSLAVAAGMSCAARLHRAPRPFVQLDWMLLAGTG